MWSGRFFPTTPLYLLPPAMAGIAVLSVQIARDGSARVPRGVFWIGAFLIVGGAAFDIAATVLHDPRLRWEANPVVRHLMRHGFQVSFVYAYAAICQSLYVAILIAQWAALLRHRHGIIASAGHSPGVATFIKNATGGRHLTWRQWFLPLTWRELPEAYPFYWFLVCALLPSALYRWYLGLEWFGILRGHKVVVAFASFSISFCAYFLWLWRATRDEVSCSRPE
jgi:hypothetical protein